MDLYQPPKWDTHPDAHCQHLQDYLTWMLQTHFRAPNNAPKAGFIPEEVWVIRSHKLRLRDKTRWRRQAWSDLCRSALQVWRHRSAADLLPSVAKQQLLYGFISAAIKFATFRMRNMIRQAKDDFLRGLATGLEPQTGANHMLSNLKRAGIGRASRGGVQRQLPVLLNEQGQPAATRADRDKLWLSHFGQQECGDTITTSDFLLTPHKPVVVDEPLEWTTSMLPSLSELEDVFRRAPYNKSAGLDGLPGELLKAAPGHLAKMTHALMAKSVMTLRQPLQWRGGILFAAWKQSGERSSMDSHRSLFVSSLLGKSLHRLVKDKVEAQIATALHPLHMGSRKGAPVTFPAMYILSHLRAAAKKGHSAGVLFLDTRAAYYRVARELAVGQIVDDIAVARVFKHFQLDPEEIHELLQVIHVGGIMADAQLPAEVRHVAKDFHHRSWFTTSFGNGDRICVTHAGSRPGESWADCIYAFVYSKVLFHVMEMAQGEGLTDMIDYDAEAGIFGDGSAGEPTPVTDGTWADDSAFPLWSPSPRDLLSKAIRLSALVLTRCHELGMQPNLKKGKTAFLLRLCGKGTHRAKREFFPSGKPQLWIPDLRVHIATEATYTHLGGVLDHRGTMEPEARRRLAIATTAYDAGRDVIYANKTISLPARVKVFEMAIRPTFFNLALWVPAGRSWEALTDGYTRVLRRTLALTFKGDALFEIPGPLVHLMTNSMPLALHARGTRIGFLCSLAQAGPPGLWAMLQAEGAWQRTVRDDLAWLVQGGGTWPDLTAASWPEWWHLLRHTAPWVKKQTNKRLQKAFAAYGRHHRQTAALWVMYKELEAACRGSSPSPSTWYCRICERWFGKKSSLSVHMFKSHGRVAAYRRGVQGSICRACGKNFWSENRLAVHLRNTPGCVATIAANGLHTTRVGHGIGSTAWRRRAIDEYTPAAPGQVQPSLPRLTPTNRAWEEHTAEAHALICDALLTRTLPQTYAGIRESILAALAKCPLYDEEITNVVEFVLEETQDIRDEAIGDYWTVDQYENLRRALMDVAERPSPQPPDVMRRESATTKYRDFERMQEQIDWQAMLRSVQRPHGTIKPPFVIQLDDLEAVWCQAGEGLLNTAVSGLANTLLPTKMRKAWTCVFCGDAVQVLAPPSFWHEPVSGPFAPVGGCPLAYN
eukprot:s516_g8.t1